MDAYKQDDNASDSLHFLDYWRIIRIRKTVILVVFMLVVITTTVFTFLLPETFSSTVGIEVKKDFSDIAKLGQGANIQSFDPYFLQNEFEKIQSPVVLYRVITNLGLAKHYQDTYNLDINLKPEETLRLLSDAMSVNQKRNTELIEITVYDRDKLKAKQIADNIAEVYRDWRLELTQEGFLEGFTEISNRLEEISHEVEAAETKVAALAEQYEITDLDAFTVQGAMTLEIQTLQNRREQFAYADVQYDKARQTLDNLKTLEREALKNALPTAYPEASLTLNFPSLFQEEQQLRRQLAGLETEFGDEHPRVKTVRAELDSVKGTIDERIVGLLSAKESQLSADASALEEALDKVNTLERDIRQRTKDLRPYRLAEQELERLRTVYESIALKAEQESINNDLNSSRIVTIIEPAEVALTPALPRKKLNIALGVVVGLVVGVGLAFFIEYLDTSVKTIDDVERALQAHVLGVIPQNVGSLLEEGMDSPHAEAYRVLRTNVLFSRESEDMNTITVVSGGAGEGKSTTLFNLATIFSQNEAKVLVVDSDLRRPSIHKILKTSNNVGLTNYLLEQKPLDEVIQKTASEFLDFLPSGKLPSSSMGILSSARMKELVKQLKARYDFVFFDSPPIMGVSDASVLASEVDITLQVIQYRRYPQPMTIRAKQMIQKVGGNLLGVVLNNINMSQDENYYYYSGYYYDYYSKHPEQEEEEVQKNGTAVASAEESKAGGSRVDLKKY